MANQRIEDRKTRDREARRGQILRAARRIAGEEGWPSVTVRRLSEEISYSQPVLYAHFENREGIVAAVAIEGFQELGAALETARTRARRGSPIEAVAQAYLAFATGSPAMYEAMFSLRLSVPFDDALTPPELRFAFAQILGLFAAEERQAETVAELFWASLHGIAELSRTGRFPPKRQKERVRRLVGLFGREPAADGGAAGSA